MKYIITHIYIIISLFMLLLTSCGQQHDAEAVVEKFLETNLTTPSELEKVSFSKLDSTATLTDSAITAMHDIIGQENEYKKDIVYGKKTEGRKIVYLRAEYFLNSEEYSATFYITPDISSVLAFKYYKKRA